MEGTQVGHATKGGMYCMRCDQPVAGQKTTHGIRNTLAIPTGGLTLNVEPWHCPNCGGPVKNAREAQRTKEKEKREEVTRAKEKEGHDGAIAEIGAEGDTMVVLTAFPNPNKKPDALGKNYKMFQAICTELRIKIRHQRAFRKELEMLPHSFGKGLTTGQKRHLLVALRKAGASVEVQRVEE